MGVVECKEEFGYRYRGTKVRMGTGTKCACEQKAQQISISLKATSKVEPADVNYIKILIIFETLLQYNLFD